MAQRQHSFRTRRCKPLLSGRTRYLKHRRSRRRSRLTALLPTKVIESNMLFGIVAFRAICIAKTGTYYLYTLFIQLNENL